MSGGHFDYTQYRMGDVAENIWDLITHNDIPFADDFGDKYGYQFDKEIIDQLLLGYFFTKMAQIYVQRIDWLVSGDDGQEEFLERLQEDIQEFVESFNE